MNIKDVKMGDELTNFREFAMAVDSNTRGQIIGDCDIIKRVHNSFSKPEPFIYEGKRKATKDDDVYHFISYLPFKDKVYELDGMQQGPILLGEKGEDWIEVAKKAINERIQKYAASEIRFNLLAITERKDLAAKKKVQRIKVVKGLLYKFI